MKYLVIDELSQSQYKKILDFAFSYSQYFSVCTFNRYHKKDVDKHYLNFFELFEKYRQNQYKFVLPRHYEKGQKFNVYSLNTETKQYIYTILNPFIWIPPMLPEDLTFYKSKKAWFQCISHEKMIVIDTEDNCVLNFFDEINIELRKL